MFNLTSGTRKVNAKWPLTVLTMTLMINKVFGYHLCNQLGLSAFCLIPNHFKAIFDAKIPSPYPHFDEIVKLFPPEPCNHHDEKANPGTTDAIKCIGSYNRYCELKYVKGGETPGFPKAKGSPGNCGPNKLNPYSLEVTEIVVDGHRMHNWLHITIKSDPELRKQFSDVTGKIKYAFLVVHDERSFAVGDFDNHLPCEHDCKCDPPDCYQASRKDAIPCMYAAKTVLTPPGQMMMYSEEGVEEIHATWRFAQFQHKDTFKTELHFRALLLESDDILTVSNTGTAGVVSAPQYYNAPYGWNPYYNILWPSKKTLGGWDYYRKDVYSKSQIKCHNPIKDGDYYYIEEYPSVGDADLTGSISYTKFGTIDQPLPTAFLGARVFDMGEYGNQSNRLYFGSTRVNIPKSKKEGTVWAGAGKSRIPNFPKTKDKKQCFSDDECRLPIVNVRKEFEGFKQIRNEMFDIDKCGCPEVGTTPPPADIPPPPIQVQGRKSHAVQMSIAWLCLVPFGMFVARYYKETYSKVFFLQEFWWYSIHVLCLGAAAMFMLGGIYAIEINRHDAIRWGDPNILAHIILGTTAIIIFLIHILLGHQRVRDVNSRMLQIMLHWAFGFVEYILAIASILTAAHILQGCVSCHTFNLIVAWLVVQFIIYILMEFHMRCVDQILNLTPPRTYLPPPVMRVFHTNAPYSKFRVYVLIVYGILCSGIYGSVHVMIKFNEDGQSCYKILNTLNATARSHP